MLHIPQFTDIPTIHSLYLQSLATAHASSPIKADDKVNTALDSKVEREELWQRKFSIVIYCENKPKHVTDTIDLAVQNLPKVKKTITKSVKEEINDTYMSHIKPLLCQGHFFRLKEFELSDTTWKSYMFNLPRNTVKFLLISVLDTLPTNSNLMRWEKRSNSKCELCSHHDTLLHTLNNCPTVLKNGRYPWRHNSVLSHIFTIAHNLSKETDWIIHSDLPAWSQQQMWYLYRHLCYNTDTRHCN